MKDRQAMRRKLETQIRGTVGARRPPGIRALALVVGGMVGASLAYFLDPERGRGRRTRMRDRLAGTFRAAGQGLGQLRRRVAADSYGIRHRMVHLSSARPPARGTPAAQRVKSEAVPDPKIPQGPDQAG